MSIVSLILSACKYYLYMHLKLSISYEVVSYLPSSLQNFRSQQLCCLNPCLPFIYVILYSSRAFVLAPPLPDSQYIGLVIVKASDVVRKEQIWFLNTESDPILPILDSDQTKWENSQKSQVRRRIISRPFQPLSTCIRYLSVFHLQFPIFIHSSLIADGSML